MDRHALAAANLLVGNEEGAAVLEAVFMGPELEFTDDALVAITGAELPPKLDGEPRETWTSFKVKRGQKLSFDFLKQGARGYIAIAGGIDVPLVLGSRSTYALGALGGFKGRKLEAGDELPIGKAGAPVKDGRMSTPSTGVNTGPRDARGAGSRNPARAEDQNDSVTTVSVCAEPGCTERPAFRTRTRPTWCDDHITAILWASGLEPLEPFVKPKSTTSDAVLEVRVRSALHASNTPCRGETRFGRGTEPLAERVSGGSGPSCPIET